MNNIYCSNSSEYGEKNEMHHENTFCQAQPDASLALLCRVGQMDKIPMDLSRQNVRSDACVMSAGLQRLLLLRRAL
jgi:hypothetical protein